MSGPKSGEEAAFSRPISAKELAAIRRPRRYASSASAQEREAVRAALDLAALEALSYEAELRPDEISDWRLEGRLTARLAQHCVITLEPAPEIVDAPFVRLWSANPPEPEDDAGAAALDVEDLSEEELEALAASLDLDAPEIERTPDPVDLGAVAVETLILSLEPYPRAPGAAFEGLAVGPPGAEPLTDEAVKPFGGLAALKARMSEDGPSDEET